MKLIAPIYFPDTVSGHYVINMSANSCLVKVIVWQDFIKAELPKNCNLKQKLR